MIYDANFIASGVSWYLIFIISTTLHEASHAYVAYRLGDQTAYLGGQVTLNPMPHIEREPMGMVFVPILMYLWNGILMGWAHIPLSAAWVERYPKKAAWVALAGPAANLALAFAAALLIHIGVYLGYFTHPETLSDFAIFTVAKVKIPIVYGLATTLSIIFFLNMLLFIFNLIPVPPLDGSSIIQLFMSEQTIRKYRHVLRDQMYALIGIFVAIVIFRSIQKPFVLLLLKILYPDISYS